MDSVFVPTGNAGKLREFEHAFSLQNKECIGLKKAQDLLKDRFSWVTPVEDRQTFTGNGYRKLVASIELLKVLSGFGVDSALVDDSGLCLPTLNNKPGVNSANFAGEPRDDARNRKYLIDLISQKANLNQEIRKPAYFVCSLLVASRLEAPPKNAEHIWTNSDEILRRLESAEDEIMTRLRERILNVNSAAYATRLHFSQKELHYRLDAVMGFCTGQVSTVEQELLKGEGHGYDAMFYPRAKPELSFASIPLAEKNRMSHRSEALRALNEWVKFHTVQDEIRELF
ncbi:MAG: non-canonical purine NTP pyrophosphatase [Silvanigrellaceae bacterium]